VLLRSHNCCGLTQTKPKSNGESDVRYTHTRSKDAEGTSGTEQRWLPDFSTLSGAEQAMVMKVREFMKASVAPIINDFWERDSFPFDVLPGVRDLQIMGVGYEGYGCAGGSNLLACYIAMEIAKVDCSFATFFGVHSGLAMGSIFLCGSEEQA
jgi:alkylation response protein AidB-like acyl-CoA dehydrogenase